ncbi:MAG: hydrogenase nickel incorporation protein HypB [Anaerolineales bacterium]|nr:hydrogenase nickel incorporation protein HypB [Anaerolineales bacterium]MCS7247077.1 hydrogenase nickel incorporation protein HypB [Anaerolineales bacterium]MDW8160888.1 hydrogenase nickel incorporation protein HypB [Anaerolineales bacterium]MDW8447559.1 hydrogenase nickel incorporation protein HypB [Anaerolineales bacterium]
MSQQRLQVVQNILSANEAIAETNRQILAKARLFSINLMASPGAGKTTLIERTVRGLSPRYRILVIEGDIATTLDAERAVAAGATAIQINTGGNCHLDAVMLNRALTQIDPGYFDLLIVENVGNLVCPASFDLGTSANVLVASVPEGHDKPHKYPSMYRGVDYVLLNKIDLLPYVDFDLDFFRKGLEALNPNVELRLISCRTGEGLSDWYQWLESKIEYHRSLD